MTKPLALVIEDESNLANIFTTAVNAAGFETETIQNGGVAQARVREVVPAMVILDLHLPDVSGLDILKQIKSDKRLAATRVIIVSADAAMVSSLELEVDLTLLKPIRPSHLLNLVSRLHPTNPNVN